MADSRRYVPLQQLDLRQILLEAQHRWLRPTEICEILRNHQQFHITPDPPVQPPAGSLFLFDRKALRYFRKDGHRWRKKKDGKTVKEAHEKLKAGSVDVLHCYYAHGEDNENFQRRSYWMLDGRLEHIVLVHYREVKEGYRSGISRLLADPGSQVRCPQTSSAVCFTQATSPAHSGQASFASSPSKLDWSGQTLSPEVEDVGSRDDPGASSSLAQPLYNSISHSAALLEHGVAGFPDSSSNYPNSWLSGSKFNHGSGPSNWAGVQSSNRHAADFIFFPDKKILLEQPAAADLTTRNLADNRLNTESAVQNVTCEDQLIAGIGTPTITVASSRAIPFQDVAGPQVPLGSTSQVENKCKDIANHSELGALKKLDSFGRWMDKEIGGDCDNSLMASDSGNYWSTLDATNDEKEVSSLSHHMQLDIDSLGPSLSQEQHFTICDFSPDWAYSGVETKVLVIGSFLGSKQASGSTIWSCMFGEVEVSAEVLTANAIRCQAPVHAPGRVPFYITCSNRLACSEVREFEYRENPVETYSMAVKNGPEEVRLQTRLAKLLSLGSEKSWLNCAIEDCDKCKIGNVICSRGSESKSDWDRVEETRIAFEVDQIDTRDILIENLLKNRLCEWLVCKVHEGGKVPRVLDEEGLGAVHLAASLGYDWAMGLIVASGVSPNYRDARGRTALHWASYFGREEAVIALLRLGAAPGAVDDPTPEYPGGRTAADLASSRGHKGIAGYLAEVDLTTHLSLLTINDNITDNVSATIAPENVLESATQVVKSSGGAINDELSVKRSLAAVRKSVHAAALIQAAFRDRSFRHRQLNKSSNDISEVSHDLVALGSLNKVQKLSHFEDYLHSAAVRIQQKYRGWKGRKEFLKIRNRIVKIQAHVRGHQVRKQYKKVVRSVSIVEKAILRWRRKGVGLRGFRVEKPNGSMTSGVEKTDEYEYLRVGRKQKSDGVDKALSRVKSLLRHPEARQQYTRMVSKFENLKAGDEQRNGADGDLVALITDQ